MLLSYSVPSGKVDNVGDRWLRRSLY